MNRGRRNDKTTTGVEDDAVFTRQITNTGTYFHRGKVVVTSGAADLVDNGDVVGPKVVGNDLVFYYKVGGVTKTVTLTGV